MSLDFAIKDFIRKKNQTYPLVLIITLIIALAEFIIYFSTSLGLNSILNIARLSPEGYENEYYFSGALDQVYSQFNTIIIILMTILAITIVIIITTTLIISKKRDIAIMKALGTLPERMYSFYLLEAYIIFFIGFILGFIIGLTSFGVFSLVLYFLGFNVQFQVDLIYTPIIFLVSIAGIFVISGYSLRKIGLGNIIHTFSRDIRYDYNALKKFPLIPRWLSKIGHNFKIAVANTMRRQGEFKRFLLVFSMILMIIFTLGLGALVLNNSSREWIDNSQGHHIIVIGHESVVDSYSQMYAMFSNPQLSINQADINFTRLDYLFNYEKVNDISNYIGVSKVDPRLITFLKIKENKGIAYNEETDDSSGYSIVGQDREGSFPLIGVNPNNLIQDFELEGRLFNSGYEIVVGDGLAINFFDSALAQSISVSKYYHRFDVSGIAIDCFYNGYAGYVSLEALQTMINCTNKINLLLVQMTSEPDNEIIASLKSVVQSNLGNEFTVLNLGSIFEANLDHVTNISYVFILLIFIMGLIAIISLHNYQKAGIMDKAKDFLIMKAVGASNSSIKKILFLEAFFVIIPALILSVGIGMIFNAVFLLERAYLPPLSIPLFLLLGLFGTLSFFNYLSLRPIMKKISTFTIKDFDIYG